MKPIDIEEDKEIAKWGFVLKVATFILFFSGLSIDSPRGLVSIHFAEAATAITAGIFDFIRYRNLKESALLISAVIWAASGVYFLFGGIVILVITTP